VPANANARPVLWKPNPGPQTRFLASTANEVLYGGAAGGGKSAASIALPLRWVHNPRFRALFLRRESKYLGDAIDKSSALYPQLGAKLVSSPKIIWTFPSGAKIWLSHCEHDKDVRNYDSFEFHLVIFEELTHFTETQYRGIRARIRGTDPTLPRATRATCNPGGEGHEWVFRRFAPWLDPESKVRALPGETLWFKDDAVVPKGTDEALSRCFIPAGLADNPHVTTEYRAQLRDLDPVRRAQLLDGNWLIKPAAGLLFKRSWFDVVDAAPSTIVQRVRRWDFAATEAAPGKDPDWTVGARWARTSDGQFYVEDVVRLRGRPLEVEEIVLKTAELDGPNVAIRIPQDPGAAGVVVADRFVQLLVGYDVRAERETGDKAERARPVSAQAERRNIKLVRGSWNTAWLDEHEAFPDGTHDDMVDTSSGALAALASTDFFLV
jgi:predicted phage terminase large subunit-like protein